MHQVAEPRQLRWTKSQYHQMADLGWFRGQRVELIDGEIIEMPPQKEDHFASILRTTDALRVAFGPGYTVRPQGPLDLGPLGEPEPDVAVVAGKPQDYADHPTSALLVVEVSDSSLRFDRGEKSSLYARSGIAEYWIVNLADRCVEIHTEPVADGSRPLGFRYGHMRIASPGEALSPLAAPQAEVRVDDLLPGE